MEKAFQDLILYFLLFVFSCGGRAAETLGTFGFGVMSSLPHERTPHILSLVNKQGHIMVFSAFQGIKQNYRSDLLEFHQR